MAYTAFIGKMPKAGQTVKTVKTVSSAKAVSEGAVWTLATR
jgi:hypothetical protein